MHVASMYLTWWDRSLNHLRIWGERPFCSLLMSAFYSSLKCILVAMQSMVKILLSQHIVIWPLCSTSFGMWMWVCIHYVGMYRPDWCGCSCVVMIVKIESTYINCRHVAALSCVCVYVCVHMCLCVRLCAFVSVCVCKYMSLCLCLCLCVSVNVFVCL